MRKRFVILSCVAVFLAALAVLGILFEPTGVARGLLRGENFHDDRPASYWKKILKEDAATGALRKETKRRFSFRPGTARVVLEEALADPDPEIRWTAAGHLAQLGANASAAVPALIRALDDPEARVRFQALFALERIGRPALSALPAVTERLTDSNERVSSMATHAFWAIDPTVARARFGWQTLESAEYGFQVVMPPGVKEETAIDGAAADGAVPIHSFEATFNFAFYTVSVSEPLILDNDGELTDEKRLEVLRNTHRSMPATRQLKELMIEQGGVKGFEMIYQAENNQDVFQRLRLFCVGRRVYKQVVTGFREDLSAAQTECFLNSLQFRQ